MNLTKLTSQLTAHEGKKLFPYTDTVGKLTIGIGHNLTDKGLSEKQVLQLFYDDVQDVVNFLNVRCSWWTSMDDVRQRALADLTFNLMGKLLDFKKMLAHLQASEWDGAADELLNSTFAHQVGKRAQDLAFMFRTGQDPNA